VCGCSWPRRCASLGERAYFEEHVAPLLGPDADYVGEPAEPEKRRLLGDAVALVNPIRWPEPFGPVRNGWSRTTSTSADGCST
jgi:hypothetical protein